MNDRDEGFTLVESMMATSILVVGLVSLAQLALLAGRSNRVAELVTIAAVLAQDRMEQLRAAEWPEAATTTCCEYFDARGAPLGAGPAAPVGAEFVRGWSIQPVAGVADAARALQVWVKPRGAATVRLVSVRARRDG
jgi:prepilin-type N-terminal cleavage/methylation domain-containing protein